MELTSADRFVADLGAAGIPHPGGTLLAHLRRVRELLAEWGCDQTVQIAGLCHAIYGTDGFDTSLLGLAERPRARAEIGADAEELVYRYASCDRSAVYPLLGAEHPVLLDRFTGEQFAPASQEIAAFTVITAANELDVVRNSSSIAAEHGAALIRLISRASRHLPAPAIGAWAEWLPPDGPPW